MSQLHGPLAGLCTAHHNSKRGGEIVGVQAQLLSHHGFQAGLRPIGQLAPGRPCLGHIGFLQAEFLGFFVKILLDGLFFRPVVVAGCHNGLHGQWPVHQIPLAKLYCKVLVEKCAIHGTDHQRANQGLLRFAHGKLRHDAFIDGGRQAFFIVFRGQSETGAVGVFGDGQAEGLKFVPQAGRLSDLRHDGATQQHHQFFHGGIGHQGFLECQNQQFIFCGGIQEYLGVRVIQVVLLLDDCADKMADFLVWQTFLAQQGDGVQRQIAVGFVNLKVLRAGEHAGIDRAPFRSALQQLAVMQVGNIKLALQPFCVGDTAESGGRLPVAFQCLQEILLRQGGALALQCPIAEVAVLLGLRRLPVQAGIEQSMGLFKLAVVHLHPAE